MKTRLAVLASLAALSLAGPALAQAPRGAAVTTLGTNKVAIMAARPSRGARSTPC
jgi:hypothetical protein